MRISSYLWSSVGVFSFCAFCVCKTKRFKITLIPSFTILLTFTPFNLPQVICTHLLSLGIFPFFENLSVYENLFLFMIICRGLFFLWESLLIYGHLWESFLFMRIFSYLWSSVKISSFYENFFMIICENLFLFMISYFITYFLSYLPICTYLLSSSFIIHAFIFLNEHK